MQISGSKIGMSIAMLRFSYCVDRQRRNRKQIPAILQHHRGDPLHEVGSIGRHRPLHLHRRRHGIRVVDPMQVRDRQIDGRVVLFDDDLTELRVRLLDCLLDGFNRLLLRHEIREGEEAGLEHRVRTLAESGRPRDCRRVDHVELEALVDDRLLHLGRQLPPHLVRSVRAVQEERRTVRGLRENVDLGDEFELVTSNEVRIADLVGSLDARRIKPDVRRGHGAGLLRVVDEVTLRVEV